MDDVVLNKVVFDKVLIRFWVQELTLTAPTAILTKGFVLTQVPALPICGYLFIEGYTSLCRRRRWIILR
jgi:hypothetical protein